MKRILVILFLLITFNSIAQNKTVVLKVASSDISNYKLISDTGFNNGYTTRVRLKQGLDSLGNVVSSNYVDLTNNQSISGLKTFNNYIRTVTSGSTGLQAYNSQRGYFIGMVTGSTDSLFVINYDSGYNQAKKRILEAKKTGEVTFSSSVTASSLIKSGGTSSQILAADGSVITAGTNVTISGGTISSTNSGGTVTSVAALTLGTTGTDLSSSVANSTTTPVITLNVPTASAANRGALSAADWTTFNNKQPAGTYVTSVTGTSPIVSSGGTTPAISIPAATTSVNGYLTSTDWTTFNGKQNALTNPVTGTGTINYLPKFTGTSTIGNSIISESGTRVRINGNGIEIDAGATSYRELLYLTSGSVRFNSYIIGAETGSNAGSNYFFSRYNDAGSYIEDVFSVNRATGVTSFNKDVTTNAKFISTDVISPQFNFAAGTAFASASSGHTYVYSGTTDFIVTSNTGAATLFSVSNTGTGNLAGALTTLGLTVNTGAVVLNSLSNGAAGAFLVINSGTVALRTASQVLSDIGAAPASGGAYLPLAGGTLTGALAGTTASFSSTSNGTSLEILKLSNAGTGANTQAKIQFNAAGTNYGSISGGYGASAPQMSYNVNTGGNHLFQGDGVQIVGYLTVSSLTNLASRLNVNGATDNSSYALNVTGAGNFSGSVSGTTAAFSSTGLFTNVTTTQGTSPYFQWTNAIGTRLSYIQHNAVNLIYNADVGSHVFNQAILAASTITTGAAGVYVYSSATRMESDGTNLYLRATGNTYLNTANTAYSDNGGIIYGNGFQIPNGSYYKAIRTSGSASINVLGIESGTDNTIMVASNMFKVRNTGIGDAANLFTLDATSLAANFTGRVNVYGATDNSSYQLNVAGAGTISSALTIGTTTLDAGAALRVAGTYNGLQAVFGYVNGRGLAISTGSNGTNEANSILDARGAGAGQLILRTEGVDRLSINYLGAATFSSTITAAANTYSSGGYDMVVRNATSGTLEKVAVSTGNYALKTSAYTLVAGDEYINVTGNSTMTLPSAVGITGKRYTITNVGSTLEVTTINTTSSQSVINYDGGAIIVVLSQNKSITVVSNGANWFVINGFSGSTI